MPRKVRTRKYGKSRVNKRKHRRSLKKKMNKRSTKKTRQYRKNRTRRVRRGGEEVGDLENMATSGYASQEDQLDALLGIGMHFWKKDNRKAKRAMMLAKQMHDDMYPDRDFHDYAKSKLGINVLDELGDEHADDTYLHEFDPVPEEKPIRWVDVDDEGSVLGKREIGKDKTLSNKKPRQTHVYWEDNLKGRFNPQRALEDPKYNIGDIIIIYHNNQEGKESYKVTEQGLVDIDTGKIPGMGYYRQAKP